MALDKVLIPQKLMNAVSKLNESRAAKNASGYEGMTDELETLIKTIYSTPETLLKARAYALTKSEARMLAGYFPHNHLNIDEDRIIDILKLRMDKDLFKVIFFNWQEAFNNRVCNVFLRTAALEENEFIDLLKDFNIDPSVFVSILESPNIPLGYDEKLLGRHFADGADFDNRLRYYGVRPQSLLDAECKRALMTFCGRSDYFSCSENNILEIISSYDNYMLKMFLLNFMSKMTLGELQMYPYVAEYLRARTGNRKSKQFQDFFGDVKPKDIQKYLDWINIYKINALFDNDERSRFWKQYRYLNVVHFQKSDVVLMEFPDYIAVEFRGVKKGTIYICGKDVFKEYFYPHLDTMDNYSLRQFFKLNKDKCESRNHIGKWQQHVAGFIAKNKIGEKIRL